jgi:hypothetical protein
VTKALNFNTILGNKEREDRSSGNLRKRRPTLVNQTDSAIRYDIPALERDDPRIELALSEGEMENYEVREEFAFKIGLRYFTCIFFYKK